MIYVVQTESGSVYEIDPDAKTVTRNGSTTKYQRVGSYDSFWGVREKLPRRRLTRLEDPEYHEGVESLEPGRFLSVLSLDGLGGSWESTEIRGVYVVE